MTLLGGFAARHKVSLRRTLYIAAGSAAVVIGMPQALESLPPPGERQAALEGAMERLQGHKKRIVHRIHVTRDTTVVLAHTAVPAIRAGLSAERGRKVSTMAAAIANAIGGLETDAERETVLIFGGPWLLDGLLDAASMRSRQGGDDSERLAAQRALMALLSTGTTSEAVLGRPGALPKLLGAAADTRHPAAPGLSDAILGSITMARLPQALSFDDMSTVLVQAGDGGNRRAQVAAVRVLAQVAEASVQNCGKLAAVGAGPALVALAADTFDRPPDRQLRWDLTRLMAVLARDSPFKTRLGLGAWLQQLLFFAADAAAARDWPLAARALDGFSAAVAAGGERLAGDLARCNVLPLAAQLWGTGDEVLRRSLMTVVAAVARIGEGAMPEGQREEWTERLVALLLQDDTPAPLRATAGAALADLASTPSPSGTAVAITWLGEVLVALSRSVTAYQADQAMPDKAMATPDNPRSDHGEAEADEAGAQGLLRAVGVGPAFARAVAAELSAASARKDGFEEPADIGEFLGTAPLAAYPSAAIADDPIAADQLLARALGVLCTLVAADVQRQAWLHQAGALPMLYRLTLAQAAHRQGVVDHPSDEGTGSPLQEALTPVLAAMSELTGAGPLARDEAAAADLAADLADSLSLDLRKQTARLLALLSTDAAAEGAILGGGWAPFLEAAAASDECLLGSDAARALLNCRSAAAAVRATLPLLTTPAEEGEGGLLPLAPEAGAPPRCVLRDGVHLFSPLAPHHGVLADLGADFTGPGAPEVDIVFVHGIRGGAFATWRELAAPPPKATPALERAEAAAAAGAAPAGVMQPPTPSGGDTRGEAGADRDAPIQAGEQVQGRLGDSDGGVGGRISGTAGSSDSSGNSSDDSSDSSSNDNRSAKPSGSPSSSDRVSAGSGGSSAKPDAEGASVGSGGGRPRVTAADEAASSKDDTAPSKWQTTLSWLTLGYAGEAASSSSASNPESSAAAPSARDKSHHQRHQQQQQQQTSGNGSADAEASSKWATAASWLTFGYAGGGTGAQEVVVSDAQRRQEVSERRAREAAAADAAEVAAGGGMSRGDCWPAAWLAGDLPRARLLSLEYAAPASGWEGESLPMRATVLQMVERLSAAGVGSRPTVFICHSLGGLLIKELLAGGLARSPTSRAPSARIARSTRGLVFYATPHAGSWLADWGWNLRYVGAAPDPVVFHLKPGAHLEEANRLLRARCVEGALRVLSFGEGVPSRVSTLLPRLLVVPPDSAAPGFGTFHQLLDLDHIQACKPPDPSHPAYTLLLQFLQREMDDAEERAAAQQAGGETSAYGRIHDERDRDGEREISSAHM